MGLFGSSAKISSARSQADSGFGAFVPKNKISFDKPFIDIDEPLEVAGFVVVLAVGFWAWKGFKWR